MFRRVSDFSVEHSYCRPRLLLPFLPLPPPQLLIPLFFELRPLLGAQSLAGTLLFSAHLAAGVAHAGLHFFDHLHPLAHSFAGHLGHHRGHHVELFDEIVDLVWLHARSGSDPAAAALVDHLGRVATFCGRHRVDHAEHPLHVLLGVHVTHRLGQAAHAGDHAQHFLHRPQLFDLHHLFFEVVERELAPLHPLFLLEHLVLVELALRLFDQRQ